MTSTIARSLNSFSDYADSLYNKYGNVVVPGALGAMGGWLIGIGPKIGCFHGLSGSFISILVSKPINKFAKMNSGTGDEKIHENTKNMLFICTIVAELSGPILLTMYLGDPALKAVASILPDSIKWLAAPAVGKEYTLFNGLLVDFYVVAAVVTQSCLKFLIDYDKKR